MRKYRRLRTSASAAAFRTPAEVGPCSASAATCSETSSMATFSPTAFWLNQRRLGSAAVQRNVVLRDARHGPVVDDLATFVAPGCVVDLANGQRAGVAGDDAIDQPGGVGTADQVLEQRGHVDERGGVPDGVVFVLVVRFVRADGVKAGPLAEVQALAQRGRPRVHGGSNRHRADYIGSHARTREKN